MALKLTWEMLFIYASDVKDRFPTVGIIGAGDMARMSIAPATALGIDLLLFTQDSNESAAQVAPHIVGDYRDLAQLLDFAKKCDLVTFEDEVVSQSAIKGLEAAGVRVFPSSKTIQCSQDIATMREKLANYPDPKWRLVTSVKQVFDFEISVMVARSAHGQATSWAPTQTIQSDGICTLTISPAQEISSDIAEQAQGLALTIAEEVSLIGVMAVEIYVKDEELFLSSLAIGPHNSGNWTIEGSRTCQFEQHLRAVLDLPLGDPKMTSRFAVMGNIFGGEKRDMYRPYLHLMARNPGLKFHQYRKEVQVGRSIGHVTVMGENLQELIEIAEHARDYMSGEIDE